MNTKTSLIVLGSAVLCGLAIAQTPKPSTPTERLDALEKEVASLRAQLAASQRPAGDDLLSLQKELTETRTLARQLSAWATAQAEGAAKFAAVLDESEQKGFTFGINPDSRVVLLAGWREFNTGLQTDVPKLPQADAPTEKGAKPVGRVLR